jgi:hypothetical protein
MGAILRTFDPKVQPLCLYFPPGPGRPGLALPPAWRERRGRSIETVMSCYLDRGVVLDRKPTTNQPRSLQAQF